MTERTITEEELKTALASVQVVNCTIFYAVIDAAFPPIFEPKSPKAGDIIWTSCFGNVYRLHVFSYMDNGKYVCFDDDYEAVTSSYKYAKPQGPKPPTKKGE